MAGTPGRAVTSAGADHQWTATRQVFQDEQYNAVQSLFWQNQRPKRSAPTPCQSNLTTPQEAAPDAAHMEVEAELAEDKPQPVSFLQPFSLQDEAALSTTVAELGVNVADHNAVQQWLQRPVGTNQDMFAVIRAYHEKVVRPEFYSLAAQLEVGLKNLHNEVFQVRKELSWMTAENRLQQKHTVGVQLLTTGWPQGMGPADREYMVAWMLMTTPKAATFCQERGHVNDHNAHEVKRYLNCLSCEPVTVPAGGEFYSTMTLLTFKAFDIRSAVLEKFGGGSGSPLYKDDNTPVQGHHIKVAPCSPQWQRKLESPLRVLLAVINSHPDHNASSRLTILWKSLTLMAPQQDDSFKEDMKAWARLFYFEENGEFQGRLEVVKELHTLMQSPPTETTTQDPNLWAEKWNQVMWGAQYELDMAEAKAVASAKSQAVVSGKGLRLGKGKRHWSNVAIHTNYYEPFPFPLSLVVVESVYYSWDELCDKFKKPEHKVGDYSISTVQGKPPAPVVADLLSQASAETTTPSAPSTAQAPETGKGRGTGRGRKGKA